MYHFSFVVLHYLSYEATNNCIRSILETYSQSHEYTYNIIVVDNASPNSSYEKLRSRYDNNSTVIFIQSPTNLGYAKGNNIGYIYALRQLDSDFIIIANNDTQFQQADFLHQLVEIYNYNTCALIGPDIITPDGLHQNPYRSQIITKHELKCWERNRRLWLMFLYMDKFFCLSKHISFFRNYYNTRAQAGKPTTSWKIANHNVVLQGACIIFTPTFTSSFPNYAFHPDTFMYCEEDILAYLCAKKNLCTYYTPALQIYHAEAVSTQLSYKSYISKEIFLTKNILKSLRILKKIRKDYSE